MGQLLLFKASKPDFTETSILMPRSHLHVKLSRKSHVIGHSRNGMGRGYLVAVPGSSW